MHLWKNAFGNFDMNFKSLVKDEAIGAASVSTPKTVGVIIESSVLDGERFILALDKKALKRLRTDYPDLVIYFPPEVNELAEHGGSPVDVKGVHSVKKLFKGWVVPKGGKRSAERWKR